MGLIFGGCDLNGQGIQSKKEARNNHFHFEGQLLDNNGMDLLEIVSQNAAPPKEAGINFGGCYMYLNQLGIRGQNGLETSIFLMFGCLIVIKI